MGFLFKKFKTKFRYALKPVFAMLVAKQREMDPSDWKEFLKKTHDNILRNPTEFLGSELPEKDLMTDILEEIFKEFFYDLKIKRRSFDP